MFIKTAKLVLLSLDTISTLAGNIYLSDVLRFKMTPFPLTAVPPLLLLTSIGKNMSECSVACVFSNTLFSFVLTYCRVDCKD